MQSGGLLCNSTGGQIFPQNPHCPIFFSLIKFMSVLPASIESTPRGPRRGSAGSSRPSSGGSASRRGSAGVPGLDMAGVTRGSARCVVCLEYFFYPTPLATSHCRTLLHPPPPPYPSTVPTHNDHGCVRKQSSRIVIMVQIFFMCSMHRGGLAGFVCPRENAHIFDT
jgi:hypothetical protein